MGTKRIENESRRRKSGRKEKEKREKKSEKSKIHVCPCLGSTESLSVLCVRIDRSVGSLLS
jgi:hypothetical protein